MQEAWALRYIHNHSPPGQSARHNMGQHVGTSPGSAQQRDLWPVGAEVIQATWWLWATSLAQTQ